MGAVKPAHVQLSHQHVDMRPAQTIVDHYLEATMADRTQAVVAGGSKFYYYFSETTVIVLLNA